MQFRAFIGLGFLALALASFGSGGSSPIDAGVGAPTSGDINSPVARPQPAEPQAPATREGINFANFKPTEFPFVTIVRDNGKGKGGGWQEARVNLEFTKIVIPTKLIKWWCPFSIGMPIRSSTRGKISPISAATMSATVANSVGAGMDDKLPQGIFCQRFVAGMSATFRSMYPGLGERVMK